MSDPTDSKSEPTSPSLRKPQKMPLAGRILMVCFVVMGLALIVVGLQGLLLDPGEPLGEPLAMIGTGVLIAVFFGIAIPLMRANQRKEQLASPAPPHKAKVADERRASVPFSRGTAALARLSQNRGVFLTQRAACLAAAHFLY
jgi:hypothetical protein